MIDRKKFLDVPVLALALGGALWALPNLSEALSYGKPEHLLTLPWADASNHGIPPQGPEWLLVDDQGRFYLESDLDFAVYARNGKYLRTLDPIDKSKNFYGFTVMEALPNGSIALLARLESSQEQWGKDNFEEHSKPGARLIVLKDDGQVGMDKDLADPDQPHSNYYLENGTVYGVHDDGTYRILGSTDDHPSEDKNFGAFASIAYDLEHWLDHVKKIPVFRSGDKIYHDRQGKPHEIKGAASSLMGLPFVEGLGPLAERNGVIFYKVVCDKNQDFINAVFVEDTKRKEYGLVVLMHADQDLDLTHGHTVFVDPKGDIFEGVGKKDGYRIYEWKMSR